MRAMQYIILENLGWILCDILITILKIVLKDK